MGEVGGYTLHLYCDGGGCRDQEHVAFLETAGVNLQDARRQARALGWRFTKAPGPQHEMTEGGKFRVICPDCTGGT